MASHDPLPSHAHVSVPGWWLTFTRAGLSGLPILAVLGALEPLPCNIELTVSYEPINLDIRIEIIKARKGMVGGEEGEFIYWFKFDQKEPYFSRWVLLFYLQNYLKVETKIKNA